MNDLERKVIETVLDMLHGLLGRSDASEDFRPILQLFPGGKVTEAADLPPGQNKTPPQDEGFDGENQTNLLHFSSKEIQKMPKEFKKDFRLKGGISAHVRKKANGSYEIRYRRNGYNISVTSKVLEQAKERFLLKLALTPEQLSATISFKDFALKWIETVKKPTTKEKTWKEYVRLCETSIFPRFGNYIVREIRPLHIQQLLNDLLEKGTPRTAEATYILLKPLFEFAVAEDLISKSPMTLIRKPIFETNHATALTVKEEKEFVERCLQSGLPCARAFIVILYTGLRRSELASAEISDRWITVTSAKTKKGLRPKKRRIPISPLLRKYLPFVFPEDLKTDISFLTHKFPEFAPKHHLHELRHTFITRCQECGISRELTSLWAGHKADNTMTSNVYTHFSDEHQLKEIEKFTY